MAATGQMSVFAAFREAVFEDFHLTMWLRRPMHRDAYVTQVVAAGAERGFVFDAAAVWSALREGELTWLMQDTGALEGSSRLHSSPDDIA